MRSIKHNHLHTLHIYIFTYKCVYVLEKLLSLFAMATVMTSLNLCSKLFERAFYLAIETETGTTIFNYALTVSELFLIDVIYGWWNLRLSIISIFKHSTRENEILYFYSNYGVVLRVVWVSHFALFTPALVFFSSSFFPHCFKASSGWNMRVMIFKGKEKCMLKKLIVDPFVDFKLWLIEVVFRNCFALAVLFPF